MHSILGCINDQRGILPEGGKPLTFYPYPLGYCAVLIRRMAAAGLGKPADKNFIR